MWNILTVLAYRFRVRFFKQETAEFAAGEESAFFIESDNPLETLPDHALRWGHSRHCFGWWDALDHAVPDWHQNPLTGKRSPSALTHWSEISDFDLEVGDIKCIWEASRMDWVVTFAMQHRMGRDGELQRLNLWLKDWVSNNPAYLGVNWKCGQEASIRVIHLVLAAELLGQYACAQVSLVSIVKLHLVRILPTISYAKAQDNNHGTSEAAGLFIGGLFLQQNGQSDGARFERAGRSLLEERVTHLVQEDGSFSQHSVNYHRLMLDAVSLCDRFRGIAARSPFSPAFYQRAAAATEWLRWFVDPETGTAPNLGANDGAELLVLHGAAYRDYRPSLHLAAAYFLRQRSVVSTPETELMSTALSLPRARSTHPALSSRVFSDGGYVVQHRGRYRSFLRLPRYAFRPIQCDALHVDFWVDDENVLRDDGSFSYNADPNVKGAPAFGSTASHNSVEFDGRDQMRKVSRFLYADWLQPIDGQPLQFSDEGSSFSAGYQDYAGAIHHRTLIGGESGLTVRDRLSGRFSHAVLRWRLNPTQWQHGETGELLSDLVSLRIAVDGRPVAVSLSDGIESLHYFRHAQTPIVSVALEQPCTVETVVEINS